MIFQITLKSDNNKYEVNVRADNPFIKELPEREVSLLLDYFRNVKESRGIINAEFFDAEYFADSGFSNKSGLKDYENFSKTFAEEHALRVVKVMGNDKSKKILEIGCAFGWCVESLIRHGYKAIGTDISKWVVKKYPRPYINQMDIQYEYHYENMDMVYSFAVFEHFAPENVRKVFQNIHKILKVGGLLFATIDDLWGNDLSHQTIRARGWWNKIAEEEGFKVREDLTKDFIDINGYVWESKRMDA